MPGVTSDCPEGLTPGVPPDGIYWGNVFHKRFHPTVHAFEYPVYLTFLDVEVRLTSRKLYPLQPTRLPSRTVAEGPDVTGRTVACGWIQHCGFGFVLPL